jgi:hypothetical protein
MNDTELQSAYGALLDARKAGAQRPVPLERILALVEGRGSEEERIETLDTVMADREMARELELLRAVAANRPRTESVRRWRYVAPLLAAAALLLIAIPTTREALLNRRSEPLRDAAQGPTLIAPAERASQQDSRVFRWRSFPGASTYSFELLTAGGTAVFTTRTSDTTVTLPADVRLATDVDYRWWVAGELADGTPRRSAFRLLRVTTAQ